jgi:ABC-type transporter Mla subunit MlaD
VRQYEAQTGEIVPTRGTVHDIGPSVSHKAEAIRRWLRHQSPAQIARALNHSQEAIDRYLADYQKVRTLAQKFPASELPTLTGLTASVVQQYLALLAEYEPQLSLYEPELAYQPQVT